MGDSKEHLYNSKLKKVSWFVKRFGLSQVIMKPLRSSFAPLIIKSLDKKTFLFSGRELELFYHPYNTTWSNERCIEVPIGNYLVTKGRGRNVLEIGNVLSHYFPADWDILDKFEKGKGVINQDILDFKPEKKYDLIVSLSTFEHIGYDDETTSNSADKIMGCFNNVIKNCLDKRGLFVMTAPVDYNPSMDELIQNNTFGFKKIIFMKRFSGRVWREVSKEEAMKCVYGKPFPYANAIMVGFYSAI